MKELIGKYEGISKILKPAQLGLFYPFTPPTPEELTDLGSGGDMVECRCGGCISLWRGPNKKFWPLYELKWSEGCRGKVLATQSCPNLAALWTPARLLCPQKFSRQQQWSGQPFPYPGDLPDPRIESGSCELQADYLPSEPPGKPLNMQAPS